MRDTQRLLDIVSSAKFYAAAVGETMSVAVKKPSPTKREKLAKASKDQDVASTGTVAASEDQSNPNYAAPTDNVAPTNAAALQVASVKVV